MKFVGAASIVLLSMPAFAEEKPIKRSMDDNSRYFEVSRVKSGDVVTMTTRQNCPTWGDNFTKRKYHCKLRKIKFIAEGSKIEKLNTMVALAAEFKIEMMPTVIGPSEVKVEITTNLPGTVEVMLGLGLAGQASDDVFIGTTKRIAIKHGRASATIGKPGLPGGNYDLEVSFYPRWGPQDSVAKAAGANSEIHALQTVTLTGTGKSPKAAQQRENDRRWVMENVDPGTRWNRSYWVSRFGQPRQVTITRWNPRIIKAYYFKSLDMTIFVNELKGELSYWRMGRATE